MQKAASKTRKKSGNLKFQILRLIEATDLPLNGSLKTHFRRMIINKEFCPPRTRDGLILKKGGTKGRLQVDSKQLVPPLENLLQLF